MQLAVIAKEPLPGRVKTRLCPPFSPEQASLLAAAALDDTLRAVGSTPAARHVLVLDGRPGPWVPEGFEVIEQRGDGFAARLACAFADCAKSCAAPVVLVGMDTPQITPSMLLVAGDQLTSRPPDRGERQRPRAVIGPAEDGGYWLIGLSRADAEVFRGVPMSVDETRAEQVIRLRRRGYDVRLTRSLRDVDTVTDALAVSAAAPNTRFARVLSDLLSSGEGTELATHVRHGADRPTDGAGDLGSSRPGPVGHRDLGHPPPRDPGSKGHLERPA
jgi:rSAM/selenodomain-associated transferase 1